jgi:hypothetical protein
MEQQDARRKRWEIRHAVGTIAGYLGFGFGLLSLLTAASESTAFATGDSALLVLGFMVAGYALGWALGPTLSALFAQPQ